ncbi:MAG TPA: S24/S26 family peptidase [Thermoanaerobaculia bacterium]
MNALTFAALRDASRETDVPLRVRGVCMTPLLDDGASVLVRARRFYLPGDVLVFRTNAGDLAAHRLLGWRAAGLVTKGDRCVVHDPPVSRDAILGAADVPVALGARVRAVAELARIVGRRLLR